MSATIRQVLDVLSEPGQVIEFRLPRARHTRSGYFDDLDRAAEAAAKLNGTASVYMTLNPCNPALLARGVNRIVDYPEATTSDRDILRRVWFPIDLDPVRPAGVSSNEAEHEAAIARAREVFGHLRSEGWPEPLVADSGNGAHLLYRIVLPNDAESTELLKRCLQALALRFGDGLVSVDEKVFNAARIWKVYGTTACKGDNTPERPHRQAKLLRVPDELEVVTLDILTALAGTAPKPSQRDARYSGGERFDLDRWISDHGRDVAGPVEWSGGRKWIFSVCPWNEEHRNRSAYIVQFSSGAIVAGCHHNGCNGKDWAALRAMYEPGYREHGTHGEAPAGGFVKSEWQESQPIQAPLQPVPSLDPKTMLPEALRNWIMDEAGRMPCPPDFIAAAALVELGAIIGARCAIKPKAKDDWLIVPNLWGGIVGLPSAKKSPAIDRAMKPLARLIAQAMEEHRAAMAGFEVDKVIFEAKEEAIKVRIKAAAKGDKKDDKKDGKVEDLNNLAKELLAHRQEAPKEPIPRRYKTNDTTVEKLGELLRENLHGLLVLRDELVGLVASWEKEGHEGDRQFFLEAWNGNVSFDTDRIKRGSIFIPNLCVSIFGGIQPDKLTAYLEQAEHALANDGMLQRFQLLVYPDHCPWEWCDEFPDNDARDRVFAVFDGLADFDPVDWDAAPADGFAKFPHFRFDEEAQKVFIEWSGDLHRTRLAAEEPPIIAQHLAKFDKLFPALALILHLFECAATGQRGPVTKEAALRAAAWCEYLEAHARRCYGLLADDGLRSAQALADKVSQGKLADGFTARDVRRNQWRYLTRDKAIQAALDWLEDEGWLRVEKAGAGAQGGRPTRSYRINPKIQKPGKPGGGE